MLCEAKAEALAEKLWGAEAEAEASATLPDAEDPAGVEMACGGAEANGTLLGAEAAACS